MAKKIRFPLEMADGAEVRDLEELQEHFDLETVAEYYKSGKLLTWLRDRYFEDEAAAIEALDEGSPDFQRQLCGIFKVEFTGEQINLEAVAQRQERLAKLREFTDEEEFINHIDQVAFDQEELADLLDEGTETIYLCGTRFTIPVRREKAVYIGINHPNIYLSGLKEGMMIPPGLSLIDVELENLPEDPISIVDHIEYKYGADSFWTIHLCLTKPVILRGKKYKSLPISLSETYNKLGLCKGDKIRAQKDNDKFTKILIEEKASIEDKLILPDCPYCGESIAYNDFNARCLNMDCSANQAERILIFMKTANISVIEPSNVFKFVNAGFHSVIDIIESNPKCKQFKKAGFSEQEAVGLCNKIENAFDKMENYEIVASMGIPGIDHENAKRFIEEHSRIFEYLKNKGELLPFYLEDRVLINALCTEHSSRNYSLMVPYVFAYPFPNASWCSDFFCKEFPRFTKYMK